MVITRLCNGLGNQMFQYALGRHLALLNNVELKLDVSYFPYDPLRNYELDKLSVTADIATSDEIDLFKPKDGTPPPGYLRVTQKNRFFDPQIIDLRGNIYLDGYWQTEKYFSAIRNTLLAEFDVARQGALASAAPILADIEATEAVAVHIRRTDYVTNPSTMLHHGVLPLEYYHQGIRYISARVANPVYYIFSDDPQWCSDNVKTDGQTRYVGEHAPLRGHEDLGLMMRCKHFIIANSSFSWWGAWLSRNPEKTVVAPKKWFAQAHIDTRDIVPAKWCRL